MDTKSKQEVMSLLPWYQLGKLNDEETALVEKAFQTDPSLKHASELEATMMRQVKADKTLLDGSIFDETNSRLDSVLARIDALEQTSTETTKDAASLTSPVKPGLLAQLKDYINGLLTGNSQNFTYAVFAALAVVQLSLLVLFILPSDNLSPSKETTYYDLASHDVKSVGDSQQVATPATSAGQTVLLISMESHFKAQGFSEILGSDVEVELLPPDNGIYRVSINKQLSTQEIEELEHELSKKHGPIFFIGAEMPQ